MHRIVHRERVPLPAAAGAPHRLAGGRNPDRASSAPAPAGSLPTVSIHPRALPSESPGAAWLPPGSRACETTCNPPQALGQSVPRRSDKSDSSSCWHEPKHRASPRGCDSPASRSPGFVPGARIDGSASPRRAVVLHRTPNVRIKVAGVRIRLDTRQPGQARLCGGPEGLDGHASWKEILRVQAKLLNQAGSEAICGPLQPRDFLTEVPVAGFQLVELGAKLEFLGSDSPDQCSQRVLTLLYREAAGRRPGIGVWRSPFQKLVETAFLIARQPSKRHEPRVRGISFRNKRCHFAGQETGNHGVQKRRQPRSGIVPECYLTLLRIPNCKVLASCPDRANHGPADTVQHHLGTDPSLRESPGDSSALFGGSETIFAKTIPKQAAEQCLAASVTDSVATARRRHPIGGVRRPNDVQTWTQVKFPQHYARFAPDHESPHPQPRLRSACLGLELQAGMPQQVKLPRHRSNRERQVEAFARSPRHPSAARHA